MHRHPTGFHYFLVLRLAMERGCWDPKDKQVRRVRYLIERIRAMRALSGPFLVSRTGDAG